MSIPKSYCIMSGMLLCCFLTKAQEKDTISRSMWSHNPAVCLYIWKDEILVMPIYKVNKEWLHLEARFNYEDKNTFSAWVGYNFTGGNKFQYALTPMLGVTVGNIFGVAPGLELDFSFYKFELYSESELVFDLQSKEDLFFYNWTEINYAPLDWLWFGLSAQRTRLYQTKLYFQPGFQVGGGYRWFGLTCYVFNPGFDNPYGVITFSVSIPE